MSFASPKTVIACASVLAVLVLFQLAVAFTIFVQRATGPVLVRSYSSAQTTPATVSDPTARPASTPPVVASASSTPVAAGTPVPVSTPGAQPSPEPTAETPTLASVTPPPVTDPREAAVERCREARAKGDMSGALAGLRSIQKSFPDDALIVSELALTYEQMGLVDKALAQWKRVYDAGERAGDLYGIAAEKLKNGVGESASPAGRDAEGLQTGSTLGIADLQKEYQDPATGPEQVDLRVAVKARSTSQVTAGEVNIQVAFYDLINNTEVEPTDARITSEWGTLPADWREERMEVLKVRYQQKTDGTAESGSDRKYLGYIVRIYYQNELQDVRAEPVKLLQYFPPPVTLSSQTEIPQ